MLLGIFRIQTKQTYFILSKGILRPTPTNSRHPMDVFVSYKGIHSEPLELFFPSPKKKKSGSLGTEEMTSQLIIPAALAEDSSSGSSTDLEALGP